MPVDPSLAVLSNNLMTIAIAVYALAMLAYAAEMAFGRPRTSRQAEDVETRSRQRESVLVGADRGTHPPAAGDTPVGGRRTGGVRESERTDPTILPTIPVGVIGGIAVALTVLGWGLHVAEIVTRGLAAGRLPWGNMYEFTSVLAFAAVTAYLVLLARQRVRFLGLFVMIPVVLGLGLDVTVLYTSAGPLGPALQSYWLGIHVTAAVTAAGIFMVASVATALYVVVDQHERRTASGGTAALSRLARKLPTTDVLDRVAYRTIAFGFPIWTFAVIAGAIWAGSAWGKFWGWDPKEVWALITWLIYAAYLHARSTAGWRGRKAAYIALLGFAAWLFNYFVINIFVHGMHSYAGLG
ncbi:MAG: c-type cytochrome biogenesis protein CcsB [Streptosporangiaceae bacterium]